MHIALLGFLVAVALVAARLLASWMANRSDDPSLRELRSSQPSEPGKKNWTVQEQVTSKIHWDAPEHEVRAWLEEKHRIRGDEAAAMITVARKARSREIRERALYGTVLSGAGMLATGIPLLLEAVGGFVMLKETPVLMAGLGLSTFWFFRYLARLVSGRTRSTIDS